MDMDTAMAEDELLKDELAGSTAVVVLVKDQVIYCVSKKLYVLNVVFLLTYILNINYSFNSRPMLGIQELLHQ